MGWMRSWCVASWVIFGAACGSQPPLVDAAVELDAGADADAAPDASDPDCYDGDGDGAGVGGGCDVQDCDDTDPETIDQCGRGCDERPLRAGCPCEPLNDFVPCNMGPEGTAGVGSCALGLKACTSEGWGGCEGQSFPRDEWCGDEVDNDCDGAVDEDMRTPCGGCEEFEPCSCIGAGVGGEPFQPTAKEGLVLRDDGALELGGAYRGPPILWVANTAEGTVSKIDTRQRLEVARYRTAPEPGEPSTIVVDLEGNVVVANRVAGGVTKIFAGPCPDQNGNGAIETSAGGDDIVDWVDERSHDECLAWNNAELGASASAAFELRETSLKGTTELVWVGTVLDGTNTIVELDARDGQRTGVESFDTEAFALAMGTEGLLWSIGRAGCPVSTDTSTLEQVRYDCPPGGSDASSLAVDALGRVWMGGRVARLDPSIRTWDEPIVPTTSTGLALDTLGNAFTGEGPAGGYRIDASTLEVTELPGMAGRGWAEAEDGTVWSIDPVTDGAHVLDLATGVVEEVRPPFAGPDVAGDLTGAALRRVTPSSGHHRELFENCQDSPREWQTLSVTADLPAGSSINIRVRQANTIDDLSWTAWEYVRFAPGETSVDLTTFFESMGQQPATFLEVEVTLRADDPTAGPVLRSLCVEHDTCDLII